MFWIFVRIASLSIDEDMDVKIWTTIWMFGGQITVKIDKICQLAIPKKHQIIIIIIACYYGNVYISV